MAAPAKPSSLIGDISVLPKRGCILLLVLLVTLSLADEPMHHQAGPHTHSHEAFSGSFESLWESRYVSEGTDNLNGAGILSELLTLQWNKYFHTDLWQGIGYNKDFAELNALGVFDFHFGAVEVYASYNHKRFFDSETHDNEIGAGLVYGELPAGMFLALDIYYSFQIEGAYMEASVGMEHEWRGLTFRPILAMGCNADYIPDAASVFTASCPGSTSPHRLPPI